MLVGLLGGLGHRGCPGGKTASSTPASFVCSILLCSAQLVPLKFIPCCRLVFHLMEVLFDGKRKEDTVDFVSDHLRDLGENCLISAFEQ